MLAFEIDLFLYAKFSCAMIDLHAFFTSSAMKKFKLIDRTARADQSDTTLATVHQNTITDLAVVSRDKGSVQAISTCGADSQLVIWNLKVNLISIYPWKLLYNIYETDIVMYIIYF